MPRVTAIAICSVVFGFALLAGFVISTSMLPGSLPAASFTVPTATASPTSHPVTASGQGSKAEAQAFPAVQVSVAEAVEPIHANVAFATATPTLTPVPPTQTPTVEPTVAPTAAAARPQALAFAARIFDRPTDAAVACGTAFDSRIWGVVKDRNGRAIYQAVVQVSSADGKHRFSKTTNSQGGFEVPGLGCTTWSVRLISVPRAPGGFQAPAIRVGLNGGRYSGAGVEFRQR